MGKVASLALVQRRLPRSIPGELSATASLDFSGAQSYDISLLLPNQSDTFGIPRTLFIDNGNNPNNVTVTCETTRFIATVPAYANGFFPLDAAENDNINFASNGGSATPVRVTLFNFVIPAAVWYTTDPLTPGFDVQAVDPTATAITARNTTLAAGVAANVFPSVASARNTRWRWLGPDVLFYNVGNTATGSASADKQCEPGEYIKLPYRTAQRISMYSVAGGLVDAEEWTV